MDNEWKEIPIGNQFFTDRHCAKSKFDSRTMAEPFFTKTSMAFEILKCADITLKKEVSAPTLIIGSAGVGKTQVLLHLHDEFRHSCYCAVSPADKSPLGMVKMLQRSLGNKEDGRHHRDVRDGLISHLTWQNKHGRRENGEPDKFLILVDEVQNLEPKAMKDMMDIAIDTKSALIMAGNEEELARGKSGKEKSSIYELQQIQSRRGIRLSMLPPTETDLMNIVSKRHFGLEGMSAFQAAINYGGNTSIREMVTMLQIAKSIAADSPTVHLHHLKEAVVLVNGYQKNTQKLLLRKVA